MGGVVESHGSSSALRLDQFHEREFCGGVLVGDSEGALATRGESIASDWIKSVRVNSLADGNGAEHFAGIAIDEGHKLVVTANNENFMISVNGQARRRFARSERPGVFNFQSFGIEFDESAFILEINEDFALTVGGGELWTTAERKGVHDFTRSCIDSRGSVRIPIESEDAL